MAPDRGKRGLDGSNSRPDATLSTPDPTSAIPNPPFIPHENTKPRARPVSISSPSSSSESSSDNHHPHPSTKLFPPFYNRPPATLPPSPSFTSLLRPPFTHPSRPTTPDSSDADHPSASTTTTTTTTTPAAAAVARSALSARAVPRAAPNLPTYEYPGFALYVGASLAFLTYLLWAFLPSAALRGIGVEYYPNRWWALAVPGWVVMGLGYIYVALASYNTGRLTREVGAVENVVDGAGWVAVVDGEGKIVREGEGGAGGGGGGAGGGGKGKKGKKKGRATEEGQRVAMGAGIQGKNVEWKRFWSDGTDAVMDVPLGAVCEILYGSGREESEEEEGE